jgi:hypothetical protein
LGPIRWHSCGTSDHLLEAARGIEPLIELDLGGGTSIGKVRELFGPAFPISIAPLVDDLRADTSDSLRAWVDQVLEENEEGPLTIVYHLEPGYPIDPLRRLHERVLTG